MILLFKLNILFNKLKLIDKSILTQNFKTTKSSIYCKTSEWKITKNSVLISKGNYDLEVSKLTFSSPIIPTFFVNEFIEDLIKSVESTSLSFSQ